MTERVPSDQIEQIVGIERADSFHYGRAVTSEQTFYILHSRFCLLNRDDLRGCPYSKALDYGIDINEWPLDQPVIIGLRSAKELMPVLDTDD